MPDDQPIAPRWAGRVPRWKIARLYENDASGICDEALIDEVAWALLARCESILTATEAHRGRAACPVCGRIIPHDWDRSRILQCEACGWRGAWEAYLKSYQDKHLSAGGLEPFVVEYIARLPGAKTPRQRLLLIDWLIHRFHWESRAEPGRSGAVCLIGGRPAQVAAFLDQLTCDPRSSPDLQRSRAEWQERQRRATEHRQRRADAKQRGRLPPSRPKPRRS
jgi:hypothetical protein